MPNENQTIRQQLRNVIFIIFHLSNTVDLFRYRLAILIFVRINTKNEAYRQMSR